MSIPFLSSIESPTFTGLVAIDDPSATIQWLAAGPVGTKRGYLAYDADTESWMAFGGQGATPPLDFDSSIVTRGQLDAYYATVLNRDTGWRWLVRKGTTGDAGILIRRIGNNCQINHRGLTWSESRHDNGTYRAVLPSGFRNIALGVYPTSQTFGAFANANTVTPAGIYQYSATDQRLVLTWASGIDNLVFSGSFQWFTSDPWPTTLPGTAA